MNYLPKSGGTGIRGVVCGVVGTLEEVVIVVVGVGGVERVVTVDIGGHVGSATSVRTYT